MTVPALTLWQPWASLVAEGVKTIETRSWKAPDDLIGDTIAIHAAARKPRRHVPVGDWLPYRAGDTGPYRMELYAQGVPGAPQSPVPLPLGAIVATARLEACLPMVSWNDPQQRNGEHRLFVGPGDLWQTRERGPARDISDQLPYGDFAPGRWAWMLTDVDRLDEPIPAKGRQRLWQWNPGRDR